MAFPTGQWPPAPIACDLRTSDILAILVVSLAAKRNMRFTQDTGPQEGCAIQGARSCKDESACRA